MSRALLTPFMSVIPRIAACSVLLALGLAGCSGGGSPFSNVLPPANAGYLTVPLDIVVAVPPSTAIATVSVEASATGFAPATSSAPCTPTGCTVDVESPPAYVRFAIALADANGKTVLSGTYDDDAPQSALDPRPAVVFGGTPTTVELSLDPADLTLGTPSVATLTALAYDAQNRRIIGSTPFATPISVTSSFAGATLSTATLTAPGSAIAVSYDGSNGSQATFAGTAGPTSVREVTAAILVGPTDMDGDTYGDATPMTVEEMEAIPTAPPIPAPIASFHGARTFATPARVDLFADLPPVADQGRSNNCTVFAGVYAIMSYFSRVQRASNPDWVLAGGGIFAENPKTTFSPTFTYNQKSVNFGRDGGSTLLYVAQSLETVGAVPLSVVPFNPVDPRTSYLTPYTTAVASAFRIKSYYIIPTAAASVASSVGTIKSYLAAGYPIYIGMVVDSAAANLTAANPVLNAYSGVRPGGHAMVLTGYDDAVAGGSFRVMNSWGTRAADGGYFWLPYSFWASGVKFPQAMVFTTNPADPAAYDV